jgi:hypothetical protein
MPARTKATTKRKKQTNWQKFITNKSLLSVVLFVLVFGGAGVYFLNKSDAASPSECVYYTYSTADEGEDLSCVQQLQLILNSWHAANPGHHGISLATDGDYGPLTEQDVKDFQSWNNYEPTINAEYDTYHLTVDGVVGSNTWHQLCAAGDEIGYNIRAVGCRARWGY